MALRAFQGVGCSHRGVCFGQERIQLYGFFGRRAAHLHHFIVLLGAWHAPGITEPPSRGSAWPPVSKERETDE